MAGFRPIRRWLALLFLGSLALALPSAASAQLPLPAPPLPRFGPAPDILPVPGQDPTPEVPRDCAHAGMPRAQVPGVDPRGAAPGSPNPLAGLRFFVDPTEPAYLSYARYARTGRVGEARLMWKVAGQPRFRWFGRWTRPNMEQKVRDYLGCAAALQPGTVPLLTVMRHQGKGCNRHYTAGGAAEDAATRHWYDRFAHAVGNARIVIAFEPDSLGTLDCLARHRRRARLNTLRYGVDVLSRLPNATIYLEAGASDWEPARRTARQLRYIGIHKVRGFMLNVTHYDWTARNVAHGRRISRRVGGKPFIVSTGTNGRGPIHFKRGWTRINVWCHPLKRGLGPTPRVNPTAKVDAYMWIARAGYSSGSCNGGPLPVGTWWPERALMYAKYATEWTRPPRGTRNGHFRRYSLRQLGG